MRNYINFLLSKTGEKFFTKKESSFDFECKDPNCPHCLEDIAQMEEDDLTDDEWLIREKHKQTLDFGEWLLSHDIVFIDNTSEGNVYDYNGLGLTMKELYEIYLKQNNNL